MKSGILREAGRALPLIFMTVISGCCCHPEVTCFSVSNPCEPEGIPYYLPKPLLIVAKNFRYIEGSDEGKSMGAAPIPESFASQAEYADLKANVSTSAPPAPPNNNKAGSGKQQTGSATTPEAAVTNNPGVIPPGTFKDGVTPDTFYTYQIAFVPDLAQKYAIKVKGGTGEFRAAMNLVNGWMFTGLGPFYLKDSSTAQNIMAGGAAITLAGRGVADVVSSLADLSKTGGKQQVGGFGVNDVAARMSEIKLMMDRNGLRLEPLVIPAYAEIRIYEPQVVDGHMEWRPVIENSFHRTILGVVTRTTTYPPNATTKKGDAVSPGQIPPNTKQPGGGTTPAPKRVDPAAPNPGVQPGRDTGGAEESSVNDGGASIKESTPANDTRRTPEASANDGVASINEITPADNTPGTPEAGFFNQSSPVENAITTAIGNQIINTLPQGRSQAQAAAVGTSASPGGGNNVTVNVNPRRPCRFCLWPWCKKKPRMQQQSIIGPDDSGQFSPQSFNGSPSLNQPAPQLTLVESGDR